MLTVLTWYWKQPGGRTEYSADHVNIWADMVRRHLTIPHRIACVTSTPEGIDPGITVIPDPCELENVRIPTWGEGRPQCFRRLTMFKANAAEVFGERFVCMDLDCVIGESLDPLFETDEDFKICKGTAKERPYNGSMMLLRAGTRTRVYNEFTPERAVEAGKKFLGSDQAWISHILGPNESTWQFEDGVFWHGAWGSHLAPVHRLMFFPGHPKPWSAVVSAEDPWINHHYRRDWRGRCLLLGYAQSVWSDVAAALDAAHYDGVIASPEAAEHWPGKLLAVARTNGEAVRLARMHGFEDVTWCGREAA